MATQKIKKYFTHKHLIFLFFFATVELIPAQQIRSLRDCIQYAIKKNPTITIARLDVQQNEKQINIAKANQFPSVEAKALYSRIGKITSFKIPTGPGNEMREFQFGNPNRMTLDVQFRMPLFTFSRITSGIENARISRKLSDIQYQKQKKEITYKVIQIYLTIALNQIVLKTRQEDLQRARLNLKVTKSLYQHGDVPELNVIRAETEVKKAENALSLVKSNLRQSIIAMSQLIQMPEDSIQLSGKLIYFKNPFHLDELLKYIENTHWDIQTLQQQLQIFINQSKIIKSGNKPSLFLVGGYNVMNGFDPLNPDKFVDNWNIGIQISIPIFDGFRTRNSVQQNQIQMEKIQYQIEQLKSLYQMQIKQKWESMKQQQKTVKTMEDLIAMNQRSLEIAEEQYKKGYISQLDVINARNQLTQSLLRKQQALFNYLLNLLDMCNMKEDFSIFQQYLEE